MKKKCSWCNESIGDEFWFHNVKVNGRTKKSEEKFCSPKCSYEYPYQASPEKGCFVATAVYGNYDHPIVIDLRFFRDNYLVKKKSGKAFISWYYKHGPKMASVIERSGFLRLLALIFIVKPLHFISKFLWKDEQK